MKLTGTEPTQGGETEPTPVPFDTVDQSLPISEKLLIPRLPVIIGEVPNPEEFSQASIQGLIEEAPLKNWYLTARRIGDERPYDYAYLRGLESYRFVLPTIWAILNYQFNIDPDTDKRKWDITLDVSPASRPLFADLNAFHLDDWSEDRDGHIYLVTDKYPTEFFVGSVTIDPAQYDNRHGDVYAHNYMHGVLKKAGEEHPEKIRDVAKPYQIIHLDESLPHRRPIVEDPSPRRTLRAIFTK